MKRTIIVLMLAISIAAQGQTSEISVSLGGGISTNFSQGEVKNQIRPMGTLNVGYAILGNVKDSLLLGFRTGLNVSYSEIGLAKNLTDSFTNYDYYGHQMDYKVKGDMQYRHQQINLELPIMFALRAKGFYFNIGCKVMSTVWNQYKQTISNADVSAYYPDYGVTVDDKVVTGLLSEEQKGKVSLPYLTIAVSTEIGYLWKIKSGHSLGFDVFVDYAPWGFCYPTGKKERLIEVAPIVNDCETPVAQVTVNPLYELSAVKYNYFTAGVKLVYAFSVKGGKKAK